MICLSWFTQERGRNTALDTIEAEFMDIMALAHCHECALECARCRDMGFTHPLCLDRVKNVRAVIECLRE